jgi:hypothetical protein
MRERKPRGDRDRRLDEENSFRSDDGSAAKAIETPGVDEDLLCDEHATASISDFAEPVELLSHAGSCACTCAGSYTSAPLLTSLVPSCASLLASLVSCCAPLMTPLVPCCAPLLTPLHANGLSLSIRYCQHRRGRREAERSRQSHQ